MSLGNLIRDARERHGWTQRSVADAARITATYLCDIEQGKRQPSSDVLARLASVLQLDEAYTAYRAGRFPPVRCWEGELPPDVFQAAWHAFLLSVNAEER